MAQSATVGLLRVLLTASTAEFEAAMKRASDSAKVWTKDLNQIGRQAEQVGSALTKTLTVPIVAAFAGAAKAAIDFESSFAGVRKTVNATEPEFAALATGFRKLAKEIPINVNELNKIGEAAGQLGIKKENIIGFSEVMAKLGVTTNLSSDQAATSLARLANITQMPQSNFDRLGSTIVALGNNFATTESEITEFGLRIAGAGKIAGLTEHQILAIGAAMSSVGVEAEAGGTSVQKVLNAMTEAVATGNKHLASFAQTAGMSAEQFQKAFREDAAGAFSAFVSGLKTEGDQAFATLDKLGLGNERVIRAFLSLANAGDLLNDSLRVGAEAWRENTALTKEAEERFKTTASQLTLLWNRVRDLGITIGNALLPAIQSAVSFLGAMMPVAEGLANAFAALPGPIQLTVVGIAGIVAAAGPAIWVMGQLITAAGAVVGAFTAKGLAARALAVAMGSATAATAANTTVVAASAAATTTAAAASAGAVAKVGLLAKAFALLTNPIGLTILGLGAVATAIYVAVTAETEMEKAWKRSSAEFTKQTNALDASLKTYDTLRNKQALTKEESQKLDAAKRELAKASGLSKEAFEREEQASSKLTDALRQQLSAQKELRAEMINRARSEASDAVQAVADAQAELNRVLSGKATRLVPLGDDLVMRELTTDERIQEVQRLNAVIVDLEKKAEAAKAAYRGITGQAPKDIHLTIDATKQAGVATQALGDKLDALSQKLKDADATINGLDQSVRQKLTQAINAGVFSMEELTAATGLSEFVIKRFEDRLKGAAKATKDAAKEATAAEKAAEKHAQAIAKQADALEKLGVVTENKVLKELAELSELIEHATAAGVPLDKVLLAIAPRLEELRKKAEASGIRFDAFANSLNLTTGAAKRMLAEISRGVPPVVDGLSAIPGTMVRLSTVADVQAKNMAESFKFFGLSTRSELLATARAAEAHYNSIKNSGEATAEAIEEARKKMEKAFADAGLSSGESFTESMAKVMKGAALSLANGLAEALAEGIRTGDWSNFKDALQDTIGTVISEVAAAAVDFVVPGLGQAMKPLFKAVADKFTGLFRDAEHEKVNDLRDEFLSQFGPGGTGPGSGFHTLARQLHALGRSDLFENVINAKKVEDFDRAIAEANKVLEDTRNELSRIAKEGGLASQALLAFVAATPDDPASIAFRRSQTETAATRAGQAIGAGQIRTQEGATAATNLIAGSFAQLRNEFGMTAREALAVLAPTIETVSKKLHELGLSGSEAFGDIARLAAIAGDEISGPILEGVDNWGRALEAAHNSGLLTQETFSGIVGEIVAGRQALLDQGHTSEDVNRLMQRELQTIWQLRKDFNYEVDEGTALLLDEAEAAGLVGDQFRSAMDRAAIAMEKAANAIIRALGQAGDEAENFGGRLDKATRPRSVRVTYDADDFPSVPGDSSGDNTDSAGPGFASRGALVTPAGLRFFAAGKWPTRGTDTQPAMLTPGEIVMNEGQQGNVASALQSAMDLLRSGALLGTHALPMPSSAPMQATVILEVDGRAFGRAVVPVVPGEARRLGVRVRS